MREARADYPLIDLSVLIQRNIAIPALLIAIFGIGVAATSFVLPDHLIRVRGLRALQISEALNWIALPQIVLVPVAALLLRWIDARLLLVFGFAMIAVGSWLDTGLTHDWISDDFMVSQLVEAVGLAFAITAAITFVVANITPPQAAAIATTVQIARLIGTEFGIALLQTFVRMREQVYSNLIGLHLAAGSSTVIERTTNSAGPSALDPPGLATPRFRVRRAGQSGTPRSLCAGLYRCILADCLDLNRRHSAGLFAAPAAAQPADPAAHPAGIRRLKAVRVHKFGGSAAGSAMPQAAIDDKLAANSPPTK